MSPTTERELIRLILANQPDTDGLEDVVTFRYFPLAAAVAARLRRATPLGALVPLDFGEDVGTDERRLILGLCLDERPLPQLADLEIDYVRL